MPLVQVSAKAFVRRRRVSSRIRTEPTTTVFRSLHDSSPNRGKPTTLLQDLHPLPLMNRADQLQSLAEGEFMANLKGLASFVSELRAERTNLVDRLRHVDAALSVLGKLNGGSSYTKPRHKVLASARKRMSLAQKARWAKRAANDQAGKTKPKRTISAAGKERIAAAQRARWAKLTAA